MGLEELVVVVSRRVCDRRENWKLNDNKLDDEEAVVLVILL